MRTRLTMLIAAACGSAALAVPAAAVAAPHHNKGLTINATPNQIIAGEGVLIYGQLNGTGNADQTVSLYHRVPPQRGFSLIGTTTTNGLGFYEFTRAEGVVESNRSWFVRGPDTTHSRTIHERVAALVTLASSSPTGTTGTVLNYTGSVTPDHHFQPVLLQEQDALSGNGWHTVAKGFTGAGSNFSISHAWARPGDYTLRALFRGDPRNTVGASDTITESIQQTQNPSFTINTSAPVVTEGQPVTISGVLDQAGSTTPEPSTQVTLYGRQADGIREALETTVTGMDGSYSFTESPVHNTVYLVGVTLTPKVDTAKLYEGVADSVTITPSSLTTTVGGSVTITGSVSPDKTGHMIYLQRLGADGYWHNMASSVVTAGSTYSFMGSSGQPGTDQLRVRIYGGPNNVGAASSSVTITVSGVAPVTSLPPAS